jgi:hypothetical protein
MTIQEELQSIEEKNGILRAEDVVEYAKNKKTALHSQFVWEDTEAARLYRLYTARQVIKASVTIIERDNKEYTVRAFVSLTTDRTQEGGGYRSITTVLSDADMKKRMVSDALGELVTIRRKYKELSELSKVFLAIDEVSIERELATV